MNMKWGLGILLAAALTVSAQTNSLTALLQKGLFAEQASRDLPAAIASYQLLATQFDQDRQLAATAVFRLGECYRAQGKTNEAAGQYQRVLRDFADQTTLVTLSRQNLAGMGAPLDTARPTTAQQQTELLVRQIALAEQDLAEAQAKVKMGKATDAEMRAAEKEVLRLKQQLAALDAHKPAELLDLSVPAPSEEDREIARLKEILKNSPDLINAPAPATDGKTPLVNAAQKGWMQAVTFLLDNGALMDKGALFAATTEGRKAMVELLLARGADVNAQDDGGTTPLYRAAEKGFLSVAEVLLQHQANLEARMMKGENWVKGRTPLTAAVNARRPAMVTFLLAQGADINTTDDQGITPLLWAAIIEDLPMLKQLIKAGAKLNLEDKRGTTALGYAAGRGDAEGVKALLAAKADPNAGQNCSTLNGALTRPDLVKLLLEAGANLKTDTKNTVLSAALDKPEALKLLLGVPNCLKADTNHVLVNATLDKPESLQLLLATGAEAQAPGALVSAIRNGQEASAELLVRYGADVNAPGVNGMTPLMMAVWRQSVPMVNLLLAKPVDVNARHASRRTALDMAKEEDHGRTPFEPGKYNGSYRSSDSDLARKISDLLRQHGALDNLPDWDRIMVTRPAANFAAQVFERGTNDWNHFTLLDALYNHYATPGSGTIGPGATTFQSRLQAIMATASGRTDPAFPDLRQIIIVRPSREIGKPPQRITVDLLTATNSVDCAQDVPLEFGDTVEIPERLHSLQEAAVGLTGAELSAIAEGRKGTVTLVFGGKTTRLLVPAGRTDAPIGAVLATAEARQALFSSADLTRVKVTRHESAPAKPQVWILDCHIPDQIPDLWLRNGDVMEVPLKP